MTKKKVIRQTIENSKKKAEEALKQSEKKTSYLACKFTCVYQDCGSRFKFAIYE
jgi:hypothetical protein